GLDKRFTDRVKGFLFYQYELKRTTNVAPTAELTPEDIGRFAIATVNPSLVRDSRDDPFNPRSGSVNGIALRSAATFLGSDVELIKATLQSRWFYQLAPKLVFAFSARIGVAERFGGTTIVPLSERFFVGGRSTVRGYDEDKLGIPQVTLKNGQPTGGNAMFVANEELRLFLPKSFGLVLFFDHGNVWKSYRDVSFSETKSTTGIGLRYNTPIGPLRLDWGYKLNREAGEDPSAFHFTLGHAF
ncbi:MAG: BamA/TamA family outer membrane protein, partial [Nitrospiria bacterium]